jgi:hypothetical protein
MSLNRYVSSCRLLEVLPEPLLAIRTPFQNILIHRSLYGRDLTANILQNWHLHLLNGPLNLSHPHNLREDYCRLGFEVLPG